jgi:hypothetical protein
MRPASRNRIVAASAALAVVAWGLGASRASAQDVGNGLWQNYRYPTSNPNWRNVYDEDVAHWGEDPAGLRPRYHSSPDVMWNAYKPSTSSPFTSQPFYTTPRWQPYIPRPVSWNGLEYVVSSAPPESSTGHHGWYGPDSPGPRGETPRQWREWETTTPEGERYLERSGIRLKPGELQQQPPTRSVGLPARDRRGFSQYTQSTTPKPGEKPWRLHESRIPPEPSELPHRDEPAHTGFTQHSFKAAPGAGQGRAPAHQTHIFRPPPLPEARPARVIYAAPEHTGFTQYNIKTTPGPGRGRFQVKTKKPLPEP